MSSDVSVCLSISEFREEYVKWIRHRLYMIKKLNTEFKWVKRPPTEEEYRKMKNIKASVRSNYNLLSDVLRFLGEVRVLSEKELSSYLNQLLDIEVYFDL